PAEPLIEPPDRGGHAGVHHLLQSANFRGCTEALRRGGDPCARYLRAVTELVAGGEAGRCRWITDQSRGTSRKPHPPAAPGVVARAAKKARRPRSAPWGAPSDR